MAEGKERPASPWDVEAFEREARALARDARAEADRTGRDLGEARLEVAARLRKLEREARKRHKDAGPDLAVAIDAALIEAFPLAR